MRFRGRLSVAILGLLVVVVAACTTMPSPTPPPATKAPAATGAPTTAPATSSPPIKIGSKNFTEQLVLGEMYALYLESLGMNVERKLNLGGTLVAHDALKSGSIDIYPEYTGTGLLAILKLKTMSDPQAVYDEVARQYKQQFNLVWLQQAPMNNTQALAVKRKLSQERNLTTISQMVAAADQLILAAVPDFPEREDGLVGLRNVYGDFRFKEIKIFDPGIKYRAFLDDQADVVLAFGTDGQISGYDLILLKDDKGLWPPYHVAPVVRQDTLDRYPAIRQLDRLAPLLTDSVMQALNWQVDGPEKLDPTKVARDFLRSVGLI